MVQHRLALNQVVLDICHEVGTPECRELYADLMKLCTALIRSNDLEIMKIMNATTCLEANQWIKTTDPLVPVSSALSLEQLTTLRTALTAGVAVEPDPGRSGFYHVFIDGSWYYIHIPRYLQRVYVISSFEAAVGWQPSKSGPDQMYRQS